MLPQVTAAPYAAESKINIDELGFSGLAALFHLSPSVGPYSYFDARAAVSQTLFDWKSINAARAASQNVKSADYSLVDARDLVILTVGYVYFLAVADEARIATDQAQVEAAQALFNQATDQVDAGTAADIDALRTKVELQTRQQQLIQAKNDFAIRKINVARARSVWLPVEDFDLTDKSPYQLLDGLTADEVLARAYASRSDYRAASSSSSRGVIAEGGGRRIFSHRCRSGQIMETVGLIPSDSTRVYDVARNLVDSDFLRATVFMATFSKPMHGLNRAASRMENLRAQIEADVRTALLNLPPSLPKDLVKVAQSNIELADQTLAQSRDRFTSGVTDSVEVVQSQEAVASAHEQYISSLYSYNFAKISLIRALGAGALGVKEYFPGK